MSCNSIVKKAVKDSTVARGNVIINDEKLDMLMEYCDYIDLFANNIDGEIVDSIVDLHKGLIVIRIQTDEIIIEKNDRIFYDLAERAVAINFIYNTEESIFIDFIFPSVWDDK